MSFVNKFLEAFGNCNCIPNMVWSKITTDITEEEKQDIFKILNKGLVDLDFFTDRADTSNGQVTSTYLNAYNKASIQIRNSLDINTEISVYGAGEGMSHLLTIDTIQKAYDYIEVLRKHLTEKPVKEFKKELQEIQRRRYANINTITCNKFDYDQPCGWLSPQGVLIECDWGEHEGKAYEIICDLDKREELEQFEKEYYSDYSRDFLVEILGYILLDCPAHDGHLSITFPTRTSKAQRIYLENYLTKIKDYDTLENFI